MKTRLPAFLFGLFSMFLVQNLKAQFAHIGLGYNFNFMKLSALNAVVDDYNAQRNYLTDDLNNFHYLRGMSIHLSAGAAGFVMGIDYSWRRNTNSAEATLNGIDYTRYLRYKEDVFAISLGGVASGEGGAFAYGLRTEMFRPLAYTRLREGDKPLPDWKKINNPPPAVKLGPFIKFYFGPKKMFPAGFFLSVYYCFDVFPADMHEVDEVLNGNNYNTWNEPPDRFTSKNHVFGFAIGYGLAFTGR